MSQLTPIHEIEHAHIVICSGKPDSPEDVQHYYVPCRRCGAPTSLRPIFEDDKGELCYDCAEKKGFDKVTHANMSFWDWSEENGWVRKKLVVPKPTPEAKE
jgi:hypothetical protein